MKRDEAITALRALAGPAKAMGATAMYLFGSTLRDEVGPASDLDLFIEYDRAGTFSLLDLVGVKEFLEAKLQVPVDLTTRDSLDPLLRGRIEASAHQIF